MLSTHDVLFNRSAVVSFKAFDLPSHCVVSTPAPFSFSQGLRFLWGFPFPQVLFTNALMSVTSFSTFVV